MLYLASDHAGYRVKNRVRKILDELKIPYLDYAPQQIVGDDYPDYAKCVGISMKGNRDRGILVCGTGFGMAIAANKISGVRAAVVHEKKEAVLARKHNNANVLCLAGRKNEQLKPIVKAFLGTKFEGGRHSRRLKKIRDIENA